MKNWILSHLGTIILSCGAILSPVTPLLLTIGFLIAADFIFGIVRAYKKREKITSRKMANTIGKIVLYNIMVLSVFFLDKYIIGSGLHMEKVAAGLIAVVETKSLAETFETLTGIKIWSKLKGMISRGLSDTKDLEDKKD